MQRNNRTNQAWDGPLPAVMWSIAKPKIVGTRGKASTMAIDPSRSRERPLSNPSTALASLAAAASSSATLSSCWIRSSRTWSSDRRERRSRTSARVRCSGRLLISSSLTPSSDVCAVASEWACQRQSSTTTSSGRADLTPDSQLSIVITPSPRCALCRMSP